MKQLVLVSDMKLGRHGDILMTHALGSCLGLMIWDSVLAVGGLLHAMLPLASVNPDKARTNPFMFVDSGLNAMLEQLYGLGAEKQRLIIKAAGCATPLGKNEMFKIGERNHCLLKQLLQNENLALEVEDIGGTISRSVAFDVSSGRVTIQRGGQESEL